MMERVSARLPFVLVASLALGGAFLAACGSRSQSPDEQLASASVSASASASAPVASASAPVASASASAAVAPAPVDDGEWSGPNIDPNGRTKLNLRQVADARRRHKNIDDNPLLEQVVAELGEPQIKRSNGRLVWYGIEERPGQPKADGSAGLPVKFCLELELAVEDGRITTTTLRKYGSSETLHDPRLAKDAWKLCGEKR